MDFCGGWIYRQWALLVSAHTHQWLSQFVSALTARRTFSAESGFTDRFYTLFAWMQIKNDGSVTSTCRPPVCLSACSFSSTVQPISTKFGELVLWGSVVEVGDVLSLFLGHHKKLGRNLKGNWVQLASRKFIVVINTGRLNKLRIQHMNFYFLKRTANTAELQERKQM